MRMSRREYFAAWSKLHGGYDPNASILTRVWLTLVYRLSYPFARIGASPDAITLLGLAFTAGAVVLAAAGGGWAVGAAAIVALSGLFDSLDGAVAIQTGRVTKWGFVLDSVADRVADALFVLVLWMLGGNGAAAVIGAGLAQLQEYARSRAMSAGMEEIGIVTIWEKPTRVIVTVMFALGAGIFTGAASQWATAGLMAWVTLGLVGNGQLLLTVRRALAGAPSGADGGADGAA